MSARNISLSIVAISIIGWVLFKCLATAWVGLKLIPAVALVTTIFGIGWLWGRMSK
jgi:hypothetical protein